MRLPFLTLLVLAGCKSDCVHMCQRIDSWLDECGYSWAVTFEQEEWSSIDDCYEDHWDANQKQEQGCKIQAADWDQKECY